MLSNRLIALEGTERDVVEGGGSSLGEGVLLQELVQHGETLASWLLDLVLRGESLGSGVVVLAEVRLGLSGGEVLGLGRGPKVLPGLLRLGVEEAVSHWRWGGRGSSASEEGRLRKE